MEVFIIIDLRKRDLPNCIECKGEFFSIKTDFREWLEFGELIKNKDLKAKQVLYLFKNEIPSENPFQALLDFYVNPNVTPRKQENDDGRIILDYIEDGEYLVGSFWNAYGIIGMANPPNGFWIIIRMTNTLTRKFFML